VQEPKKQESQNKIKQILNANSSKIGNRDAVKGIGSERRAALPRTAGDFSLRLIRQESVSFAGTNRAGERHKALTPSRQM